MFRLVYLAGPISGLTHEESVSWRYFVEARLRPYGYRCVSPMRGKDVLANEASIGSRGTPGLETDHELVHRDHYDVHRCDAILVNLYKAKKVSIGSLFEMAWAKQAGKFVLTVFEDGGIHDHAFVREASSRIVPSLDEAIEYLKILHQGEAADE